MSLYINIQNSTANLMSYRARDLSLLLYQKFFDAIEYRGGKRVVLIFGRIFGGCTPAFAEPYRIERTGGLWNWLSALIYVAAFVHCLILTAVLAALNGTFLPVPGNSIEFLEDKWNIFLYAVVCPAYVTLCIRLVLLAMERDPVESSGAHQCSTSEQTRRLFLCLFLICLFSSVLITNYVNDALDPSVVARKYWFVEESGDYRRLNSAGLYYIVLNFSLLFVTFLGGAAFISISIDGIRLSRALVNSSVDMDFKTYKQRLDRLVVAYFWGVLLVACYAVNIIVWKHSPLGDTANIHLAGAVLTILGIFFVTVPRRFIEHVWSTYCARKFGKSGDDESAEHQDIVPIDKSRAINTIQALCIVGWLPNFYKFDDYVEPVLLVQFDIRQLVRSPLIRFRVSESRRAGRRHDPRHVYRHQRRQARADVPQPYLTDAAGKTRMRLLGFERVDCAASLRAGACHYEEI